MTSKFIILNGHKWEIKLLGENAVLLEAVDDISTEAIHETLSLIEYQTLHGLTDIVPAYTSIALIFDALQTSHFAITTHLKSIKKMSAKHSLNPTFHHIPVNYEKGLDWQEVTQTIQLSKTEIIEKHQAATYHVAMLGFLPGFVYLSGLDEALYCPRKAKPRTRVPAGAVGIGGDQTGIYGLSSPGGWQIIGQTNVSLLDPKQEPPNRLNLGDIVRFVEDV